jgi:transposase
VLQHYQSKILDHLGLVAAMFDELEIGQRIDQAIAQDFDQRIVSVGQAVKAMVLNGLGFVNQRLYLMPQFFQTKPTERLIGPGIEAEHLNDDTLGRALDALYDYGVSELFRTLAAHAALRLGLKVRYAHLDSTSFHLDGRYNSATGAADEGVIHIRPGYSRDHRPDLNQLVLDLIVEQQAGVPLLMEPLSGNSSDQDDFPKLIEAHLGQLELAYGGGIDYVVADCALYNAEHLQKLDVQGTKFITRVPETISEAKAAIEEAQLERMQPFQEEGYHCQELRSNYGGVEQRWLVVFSEAARTRAQRSVSKRLLRESEREAKAFRTLCRRSFACREDAEHALAHFERSRLQVSSVVAAEIVQQARYGQAGRPKAGAQPERLSYRIGGYLASVIARRDELIKRNSCFIIATNELAREELSNAELLAAYKGQSQVERGFRFLKDPMFLASSLFLKSEKRIMALLMVMTVCLLVYAALEWRIREGLSSSSQQGASFPDQKGRASQRPTARWVFQYFVGVHVLSLSHQQHLVLNLNEHHRTILVVLGRNYERLYSSYPL